MMLLFEVFVGRLSLVVIVVVRRSSFVVRRSSFVVRRSPFVVCCCLLFVVVIATSQRPEQIRPEVDERVMYACSCRSHETRETIT